MTPFESFSSPHAQQGIARVTLMIAAIALVVVLAAGGGTVYFLKGSNGNAEAAEPTPPKPTFVKVEPMTVNLAGDSRVLYIGLSLAVADQETADQIEAHMPEVRNRMLITLSDQQGDKLASARGKRQIAETLRQTLRAPYAPGGKPVAINGVLFTDFIVQ